MSPAPIFEGRDDVDELLAAYALDAVDADEAALVERYLAANEEARRELDELRAVAAGLADDADDADDPPAAVWERIAGAIAEDAVAPVDTSLEQRRVSRQRGGRGWAWVAAAAVVLAVVGLAFGAVQYQRAEDSSEQLAAGAEARFDELAADPDHQRYVLLADDGSEVAEAVVLDGEAVVDLRGLSAPEDGDLQLWGLGGEVPVSIGVTSGGTFVSAAVPDAGYDTLAVSVEPAGGSAAPTTVVAVS